MSDNKQVDLIESIEEVTAQEIREISVKLASGTATDREEGIFYSWYANLNDSIQNQYK